MGTPARPTAVDPLYLDFNATTPIAPAVLDAMMPWLRDGFGNPSSAHARGTRARAAVERARAQVAHSIGAEPDEILFTSGGTEANNLAILGVGLDRPGARFATSTVEHPATSAPLAYLERRGAQVVRWVVDARGQIDETPPLHPDTTLISVILANNETGALQPVAALGRTKGTALLHTDAAQALGKIPVDVRQLGVDLLSIAGHKLYAPKGVGALYVRRGTALQPVQRGASHERGLRPGTENVASIVGLGEACALGSAPFPAEPAAHLLARLRAEIPGIRLNGPERERLPNTVNVGFPGVTGSAVLALAPEVEASTGSACHAHGESPSAVLSAMGQPAAQALGAVRLSTGRSTTVEHADRAANALIAAWQRAVA